MYLIDFNNDVYSVTDVGLVRKANEDSCYNAETPNGFLFVVCDGMGGHVGGARASSIAVNSIVEFFTKEKYAIIQQALADALTFANSQILAAVAEDPELKGMGTTACVALLNEDKVWFAHVGDSRIYLFCNKQRQLHHLTKDHSVVQGLVDEGVITAAEAEHHPHKNRILKALGIKDDVQPEVCSMPVLPANGDVVLVCSDGLSGMVNDDILQYILEQKTPLQEKGENMLTMAKQAGGTDNITLQLIQISNSPHQNSVFESKNNIPAPEKPAARIEEYNENRDFVKKMGWDLKKIILIGIIALMVIVGGIGGYQLYKLRRATSVPTTPETATATPEPETATAAEMPKSETIAETPTETQDEETSESNTTQEKYGQEIKNIAPKLNPSKRIVQIFNSDGKYTNNEEFDGKVVFENGEYFEGEITISTTAKPYGITGTGIRYYKNGTEKNRKNL